MIKKHYSIFDTTAQCFLNPFECKNHADAIRLFTTFVNGDSKESNIALYPTQFMLFYMYDLDDKTGITGTYSAETATMDKQKPPRELINGAACKNQESQSFTVKQLVTMLKAEIGQENILNMANYTSDMKEAQPKPGLTD